MEISVIFDINPDGNYCGECKYYRTNYKTDWFYCEVFHESLLIPIRGTSERLMRCVIAQVQGGLECKE